MEGGGHRLGTCPTCLHTSQNVEYGDGPKTTSCHPLLFRRVRDLIGTVELGRECWGPWVLLVDICCRLTRVVSRVILCCSTTQITHTMSVVLSRIKLSCSTGLSL